MVLSGFSKVFVKFLEKAFCKRLEWGNKNRKIQLDGKVDPVRSTQKLHQISQPKKKGNHHPL
jgi:hypothetical protein